MGEKMKNLMLTLTLAVLSGNALAAKETFTVETVEVKNFQSTLKGYEVAGAGSGGITPPTTDPTIPTEGKKPGVSIDDVGKVIAVAKDIVALGEDIYKLVQKGKPTNTTDFTPIAIVPRDPISKEVVSPFDMEGCSMPTQKKYVTTIRNSTGGEGVRFEYMVVFTHSCSYNGNGKFIQTAMVQPVSVKTSYGWDFNASMKLASIMNYGSKDQPVAGAMITIKYSMNSWHTAFERNDTIHITAKGEVMNLSQN
jgi:hypothetical protein